ncbi:hypothetical protein DL764_009647 [Monosporascus ibericus]|uniref:FAD-binding PCMH-type domain-containing protein n=1 Tax=Monosporascus ibericus TaxID=155417 RepID=A0A4V1X8X3_9PEZI|nr:hypothetical protein DL764_009647 [Monosporascus ibericus]
MPYLPVNGGHGAITTVGRMRNGIQIWMDDLNSVTIAQDGKTAQIGGGALSKTVIDAFLLGPGLGGGHGFLQGRYGLISDNFVSVNIVMADGNLHTIDECSDLWWAIQGAGHNFGIVTSVTSKIYDIEHRTWSYTAFTFTGDKIEQIYQAANDHLNGTQPMDVTNYSFFINLPSIDPNGIIQICQRGPVTVTRTHRAKKSDLLILASLSTSNYTILKPNDKYTTFSNPPPKRRQH